ncbi:hypothetical protein GC197_03130 [bacterium]|nr:hypothetical protein [bacterium]
MIDDPCREDFGAIIWLDRDKKTLLTTASWQGDDAWALVFSERRGCIGWLFDRKPNEETLESLRKVKLLVDDVVRNDPNQFRNLTWIDDDEFPGFAQNFVI